MHMHAIQYGCSRTTNNNGSFSKSWEVLHLLVKNRIGTKRSLQDRVEDDVREEQNALNEDEGDADGKRSPSCLSTFEKLVIQDARLGAFPLINAEADHDDKSNDETGQDSRVGPREKATSQVESREEQGEASRKEAKSDEVKML